MERLSRRDGRFVALCLAVIVAGAAVGIPLFPRAFPEASIDFRVTREEARKIAERALSERGFDVAGRRVLAIFDHDDTAKVFLERELGLERAQPLLGGEVPVWRWSFRFVRPLEKGELLAFVAPSGELLSFRRVLAEGAPGSDPGPARARALAEEALRAHRGLDAAALKLVEAKEERRPARVDRTFVWESSTAAWKGAAMRYLVEVQGDQVGRSTLWLEVPEAWRQEYATLRSKNHAAGAAATFGLVLTAVALVAAFFGRLRRRDVPWRAAIGFGLAGAALQAASSLNELPLTLFWYDTTESWGSFAGQAVLADLGSACLLGVVLLLLVAGGEPEYREAYPDKPALGRLFTPQAFGTKRFFLGLLAGYALTAGFLAWQVLFYLSAERLGAWSPADVPYSNLLGTKLPWLGVLLMGFVPATTEEFSSRMFSIPFLQRFAPTWVAVGLPALIWGFAHAGYPNQPFWVRGVEVGLAGVVVGVVMLRRGLFPLLVWHFTIDAVYTSLLLVRSSSPYFVVSGLLAAGALLLPFVVAGALAWRRGGFVPESGLSNGEVGSAPPPPPGAIVEVPAFAPPKPLPSRTLVAALVGASALVLLGAAAFLPTGRLDGEARVTRTEALAAARAFVRGRGDDPARYLATARIDSSLPALEEGSETGRGLLPYRWERSAERWLLEKGGPETLRRWAGSILPGPVWQVRFVRERDRHAWWVVVDTRDGRVVSFARDLPEEEAGEAFTPGVALERAREAARARGIDPEGLTVVSAVEKERKGRKDHRVVFESTSEAAGEARRRVLVDVAGGSASLVATALKLPEEWVRARRRSTGATWAALGAKVVGFGTVVGLGLVVLLLAHRAGRVRWREAARWAALLTLPALLERAARLPTLLQSWPPETPLAAWAVSATLGVLVGLLVSYALALVACGLVTAAAPHAFGLVHRPFPGARRRALVAGGATALLVLSARRLADGVRGLFPASASIGGFDLPSGVDGWLPAASSLASATELALLAAGGAAIAALLARELRPSRAGWLLLALAVTGCWAPLEAWDAAEVVVPLVVGALPAAALALGAALLLKDDPRAFLTAAAGIVLLREGAALASSGVPSWALSGGLCFAAAILVAIAPGRGKAGATPPRPSLRAD
ncbi:MAG: CPBP family glutamic-type intramembrane protease [Thermoanaerobaculia bacterium]